jgi:hypothetical protein
LFTRWRKRISEEGGEWLLTKTIEAGRTSGAVEDRSLEQVAVDITIVEKAIAHPIDARPYDRARTQLMDLAQAAQVELRQSLGVEVAPHKVQVPFAQITWGQHRTIEGIETMLDCTCTGIPALSERALPFHQHRPHGRGFCHPSLLDQDFRAAPLHVWEGLHRVRRGMVLRCPLNWQRLQCLASTRSAPLSRTIVHPAPS